MGKIEITTEMLRLFALFEDALIRAEKVKVKKKAYRYTHFLMDLFSIAGTRCNMNLEVDSN